MDNYKLINEYIEKIKNKSDTTSDFKSEVVSACENILSYLYEHIFDTDYFTYQILLEASKLDLNHEKLLKEAIFYLTDSEIDVLVYKFEIYDEDSELMVSLDTARIFRFYLSRDFCHPLHGYKLSFEEFNEEVIPFFSTSENFKKYFGFSE